MSVERTPCSIQSVYLSHHKNHKNTLNSEPEKGDICLVIRGIGNYTLSFSSYIRPRESQVSISISIKKSMDNRGGYYRRKVIHLIDQTFHCDPQDASSIFHVMSDDSDVIGIDCRFFKLTFSFMSVRFGNIIRDPPVDIPDTPDMLTDSVYSDLIKKGIMERKVMY